MKYLKLPLYIKTALYCSLATTTFSALAEELMETRVQFRIESETKKMAKQALEKKGISLSDALRAFLDKLAAT
ncbi:type II toxin-antitoxin system RelB/DinJ family antitoxin, partial [Salmonella enterica subsp. enterica serovar Anatum]|nr:type II toxin-antitoxin system RelB/DinJ family antitoxin [Salmonella enterica subsp. enterica serovar Anatum]